ncbi:MAG: pyridoxal-phosphate dependent enzyme [Nitratireductor sp.]
MSEPDNVDRQAACHCAHTELAEIIEAAKRIAPHVEESPVIELPLDLPGKRIFIKDEGHNQAGAFKLRGALNAVLSRPRSEISGGVCTVGSGNMAYAVATAARIAGVPMAAYMYAHAPQSKMEGVRANGGEVRVVSDETYWSYALAKPLPTRTGAISIRSPIRL